MPFAKSRLLLGCLIIMAGAKSAHAEDNQALEAQIQALTQKVNMLSDELAARAAPAPSSAVAPSAPIKTQIVMAPPPPKPFIPPRFRLPPGQESAFTVGNDVVSFTPYGLISLGVETVSNSGGKTLNEAVSGPQQLPRLGGRVYWNLGNGNSALAVFELGYSATNGTMANGGRIFGRQVYAGLSSESYGTVTVGRQYDDVVQNLGWSESATNFATEGNHIGDNDNLFDTFRLNNDVRYASPKFHNVSLSASYAFSNTNESGNNSAYSAGILYDNRVKTQGLRVGGAFVVLNTPNSTNNTGGAVDSGTYGYSSPFISSPGKHASVSSQRIAAVGSSYTFGRTMIAGDYSNVQFNYLDSTSLNLANAEIFATHYFTAKLLGGVGFTYTWGRYTDDARPNYKQLNIGLDYFINRYVDLFLVDNYQTAGGSAHNAWIYGAGESSSRTQNVATTGFRVKF